MRKIVLVAALLATLASPARAMTPDLLHTYAKSFMTYHLAKESAEDLDLDVIFGAFTFKAYVDGVNDASPFQVNLPDDVTVQEIAEIAAVFILYSKDKYESDAPPAAIVVLALIDKYGLVEQP